MKKYLKLMIIPAVVVLLCGCEEAEQNKININEEQVEVEHTGKCLEYTTKYKLDCGFFTCSDSFCCERKYNVCIRWED